MAPRLSVALQPFTASPHTASKCATGCSDGTPLHIIGTGSCMHDTAELTRVGAVVADEVHIPGASARGYLPGKVIVRAGCKCRLIAAALRARENGGDAEAALLVVVLLHTCAPPMHTRTSALINGPGAWLANTPSVHLTSVVATGYITGGAWQGPG